VRGSFAAAICPEQAAKRLATRPLSCKPFSTRARYHKTFWIRRPVSLSTQRQESWYWPGRQLRTRRPGLSHGREDEWTLERSGDVHAGHRQSGGSVGQHRNRLCPLVMTERGADKVLSGKLKLGAGASAVAGLQELMPPGSTIPTSTSSLIPSRRACSLGLRSAARRWAATVTPIRSSTVRVWMPRRSFAMVQYQCRPPARRW